MQRRKTAAQAAVLELFAYEGRALNPEMVEGMLSSLKINRSTIYRILHRFVEDGRMHSFVGDDGRNYFAACTGCEGKNHRHDHFHFRCLRCERVECLSFPVDIRLPLGYRVMEVNATIAGICADCTESGQATASTK